jgi:thiazole synthase
MTMTDGLVLGGREYRSRLLLGTGKFASPAMMVEAMRASGAELVTVALRRFNPDQADDLLAPLAALKEVTLVPNTSGARTAKEAVVAAELGRELTGSALVKLEIHPNPHHLMPDPIETLAAAVELVRAGFLVLPYMPADPVLAKRLEDAGCAAVMPLGSAIGSGRGLATADLIGLIIREARVPVIVDAGLRSPSEAAAAMEMGCAAVLVNSAIAAADDPAGMARAFALAVQAGRGARRAGIMPRGDGAQATSPLTSFLDQGA